MPSWPSMVVGEAVRQSVVKLFVSYGSHPVSHPCHPVQHAVLGQSCALAPDLVVFSVPSLGPPVGWHRAQSHGPLGRPTGAK